MCRGYVGDNDRPASLSAMFIRTAKLASTGVVGRKLRNGLYILFFQNFLKKLDICQKMKGIFALYTKSISSWRHIGECAKVSCCESAGQSSLVKG